MQPIAENLWWAIPGKLAGVRKPTDDELNELRSAGIGAIVSVLDDPSNLDLYDRSGIPHLWLSTKGGTPPSREQVRELQQFVDEYNQQGMAVAVHCTNGLRRTGTMLAAYLIISTGITYERAILAIQTANPAVDLREAQIAFLRDLAAS